VKSSEVKSELCAWMNEWKGAANGQPVQDAAGGKDVVRGKDKKHKKEVVKK